MVETVDLHAVYSIQIYLRRLYDIHLPHRGYYQIRLTSCRCEGKEVDIRGSGEKDRGSLLEPSSEGGTAISKTVELVYKNEEHLLHNTFSITLSPKKFDSSFDVTLNIELWFMESSQPPRRESFNFLSNRVLNLRLSPIQSVHAARSVTFPFHSCASVSLRVSASLVSLLPRRKKISPDNTVSLKDVLDQLFKKMYSCLIGTTKSLHNFLTANKELLGVPFQFAACMELEEVETSGGLTELERASTSLSSSLSLLFSQVTQLTLTREDICLSLEAFSETWRQSRLSSCCFSSLCVPLPLPVFSLLAQYECEDELTPLWCPSEDGDLQSLTIIVAEEGGDTPSAPFAALARTIREAHAIAITPMRGISLSSSVCDTQHVIVLVHGLEGGREDLLAYRVHLTRLLKGRQVFILSSEVNEGCTWQDIAGLGANLLAEVDSFVSRLSTPPTRVSFIGHSLGGVIIRAALSSPEAAWLLPRLHTLVTVNSPHLGLVYGSAAAQLGASLVQWWKQSASVCQLTLRDSRSFSDCLLVRLASRSFSAFRHVLVVGTQGDGLVPVHSALLCPCPQAMRDKSTLGAAYTHMLEEIGRDMVDKKILKYCIMHRKGKTKLLGRASHTACVNDELFVERFLTICAAPFFM